jgi:hypothetical protein
MYQTNGLAWKRYVNNISAVQEYLNHPCGDSTAIVPFKELMKDTGMSKPPTPEWYKLHLLTENDKTIENVEKLWASKVIAWGLNIWEQDLVGLIQVLVEQNVPLRCDGWQKLKPPAAYINLEEAYDKLPARFAGLSTRKINYQWYMVAIHRIVVGCWKRSFWDVQECRYNKWNGTINDFNGRMFWNDLRVRAAMDDNRQGYDSRAAASTRPSSEDDDEALSATSSNKRKDPGNEDTQAFKRLRGSGPTETASSTRLSYKQNGEAVTTGKRKNEGDRESGSHKKIRYDA